MVIINENGNDRYMKVRRVNFKGIYDVDLKLKTDRDGSYRRNIIFMGGDGTQTTRVFNYGTSSGQNANNGFYSNFDSRWAGVTSDTGGAAVTASYSTRLNFNAGTAQLTYNGAPSDYTGA